MQTGKTIYLANPYGFSESAKKGPLRDLVRVLSDMGLIVWEPFARNNQPELLSSPDWAYRVGQRDTKDVLQSDGILAVVNGTPPDEGVMVELGMAMAFGKDIFLFRDDFRRCTDSGEYPLNLMLFAGLPRDTWRDYYYTSLADLCDPSRPLYQWAQGALDLSRGSDSIWKDLTLEELQGSPRRT